uniref:Uncharacterized protein n=1 Tax=Knipowitschia caucasica TaxID=637954 RepID=A0AAV2JI16_KNICA
MRRKAGTEGPRPTEFVADFLHNLLHLDVKPILDRAHRTLRPRPGDGAPPRPFVVRVNQFQTRNEILRKAHRGCQQDNSWSIFISWDILLITSS